MPLQHRSLRFALVSISLILTSISCGDNASTDTSTTATSTTTSVTSTTTTTSNPTPDNVFATTFAVNIVDPEAMRSAESFLARDNPNLDLIPIVRAIYDVYPDEFDFLYILTRTTLEDAVSGRFLPVRRPISPQLGLDQPTRDDTADYALRLKGIVGLNNNAAQNGPMLHETAHYWAMYLDASLGFGQERDRDWGAHWGIAGTHGQLGGFDPTTLQCADDGDTLPCTAREDGRIYVRVARFGPNQNGGDSLPFSPIELYLMGLIPASDVTDPIPVLRDAALVEDLRDQDQMIWSATQLEWVHMDDILRAHGGERDPLTEEERTMRGALVVFSETPLSEQELEQANQWAKVFAGEQESFVLSFAEATGNRATMNMRIPDPKPQE